MCLISFSWDSVIYCTPTSVRVGESIRVLVKWLTEWDCMAKSHLSQTHSLNSNCPLGIWILHGVKPLLCMGIVTLYCLLNIQRGNQFWFQLLLIHEYLLIILWWFWFLVPRSCTRINRKKLTMLGWIMKLCVCLMNNCNDMDNANHIEMWDMNW